MRCLGAANVTFDQLKNLQIYTQKHKVCNWTFRLLATWLLCKSDYEELFDALRGQ